LLRHVKGYGQRRTVIGVSHGTMAGAMHQALGAKKSGARPTGHLEVWRRWFVDVQENIPIKVVVFNNGLLGLVDLEMKAEGLLHAYCDLQNPSFAGLAEAIGFHAARVERANDLDAAVRKCLAQTGLAVVTDPMELVMPPTLMPKRYSV
jgi:pyruvate dehydrogenase (quinone)